MHPDPVDTLLARIEELERLFDALRSNPESPAWREIQQVLAASRATAQTASAPEPLTYIRGGFGEEMDAACSDITDFFLALPGWHAQAVGSDEVVYLAGFFAFLALASSPTRPLSRGEAAVGARATVARMLMVRRTSNDALAESLLRFKRRLHEYSSLWAAILKGEKSFGAFAATVFENVRVGGRTRDGYGEHLDRFPAYCEARIRAFHEAAAGSVPMPEPSDPSSGR